MTRDEEAAEKYSNETFPVAYGKSYCDLTYNQCSFMSFKAGIEYERKRSQVLLEALEKIIDFEKRSDFNRSLLEVSALAKQALNDSANTPEKTLVDKNSYKKENK